MSPSNTTTTTTATKPSIRGCLNVLGIIIPSEESIELFLDCDGDLDKEFITLKKIYFRKILKEHP